MAEPTDDELILRPVLMAKLDVCSETVRRWLKGGKLPPLDVYLSKRKNGWKRSTLAAHGVKLP